MKYLKYLRYVILHKYYVGIECFKKGLYLQGILHDLSKFRLDEFIPYSKYFYGIYKSEDELDEELQILIKLSGGDYKEKVEDQFNLAWLYHQKRNKHHWQYWILQEDSGKIILMEMPDKYIIEMICDWIGAGKSIKKIGGIEETIEWYNRNKDVIKLHDNTRKKLENYMNQW